MYRILILSCLWHFSLLEGNFSVEYIDGGDNNTLSRPARARVRFDRPVECKKLHGTDDSAFIAIILNKVSGRLLGMGSIIDEKHILTANRAVHNVDYNNLRVLLGYFKAYWGRHSYVHYVEKVLKHEHDLVILRLTKMITFSRTIKPIRLLRLQDADSPAFKARPPAEQKPGSYYQYNNSSKNESDDKVNNTITPDAGSTEKDRENNTDITLGSGENKAGDKNNQAEAKESSIKNGKTGNNNNNNNIGPSLNPSEAKNGTTTIEPERGEKNKQEDKDEDKAPQEVDPEGKEVEAGNRKVYRTKSKSKEKKIKRAEETNRKEKQIDQSQSPRQNDLNNSKQDPQDQGSQGSQGSQESLGRQGNPPPPNQPPGPTEAKDFTSVFPTIKTVLLVGFPLSHFDVIGDPISQTLIYGMREEKVINVVETKDKDTKECINLYMDKPTLSPDDPENLNRFYCTDAKSGFCWGCVGGPTLFKREQEYIQVGVVGGASCEKDDHKYMHIRVDAHMKWIAANSLVVPKA